MPGTVSRKIKSLVNHSIDGEVNFSRARLSFFNHFPSLTLTLHDFTMTGSPPFKRDTILSSDELGFGIDIPSLIRGDITVDKFFLTGANINIIVNENGEANYNVYKSSGEGSSNTSSSGGDTTASLKIRKIVIENSNVVYDDRSSDILLRAKGLSYSGKGDLGKAIFDLRSHLKIDSFDLYYDQQPYILKKRVRAELVTNINTNSLALKFPKNRLRINKLPLEFTGRFDFLSRGYDMDFRLKSRDAELYEVFTALPPSYQGWLEKTKVKGSAGIVATLSGKQVSGTDTMPNLEFDMKVRDGFIAYDKSPLPVSNIYLDFAASLPALNVDSVTVNVDSVFFNLDKDHFSSVLKIKGYKAPYVFARTSSKMNLEKLDRAMGLQSLDLKGQLNLQLWADGRYAKGQNPESMRKEIVVTSIPAFSLISSMQNGYFHYTALPKAVEQFNFSINASCPDHNYHNISAAIENIDIKALNNYVRGFVRLKNSKDFPIDAYLDALIRLSDIQQFYPLDSLEINGDLVMNIKSSGNYLPAKRIFPKTQAVLKLDNGSLKTKYYPTSIDKINVDAMVQNKDGTFQDLQVDLKPVSFEFEGKPFVVKADLENFDNLRYDITSKGTIDLGRIYRVFSREGIDVKGSIETDLSLKGTQADAVAGRLERLNNRGVLKVNDITLHSELYPLPFFIDKGIFRFHQDDMKFEEFRAKYGKSTVMLNGAVSNLFNYMAGKGPLKGNLQLRSDYILLDELMAYESDHSSPRPDSLSAGSSGVIIVPDDLDLRLIADVKNVDYNKLHINDVKGDVQINEGQIGLKQTGFTMAGAVTTMGATYRSVSPARAYFTYHVVMNDFDVKRMYKEVELFRELAPSAGQAEGIISLDYGLEGRLDDDMYPIMPSLKGSGVLGIKKVKMRGFKLFSAMGKETGKNEINDPDLSKIDFKTSIKNNVVTLERTKMKVAGFRIRIQGQTDFDGRIKLKCRLGLPPFGIIGIPMNISGTGQNPKVKLGKGDELPLEEREEEEAGKN
jgi:AsmA protein